MVDDVLRGAWADEYVGRRLTSACTRPPTRELLNLVEGSGRRVMRGVGRLVVGDGEQRLAGRVSEVEKQLRVAGGAW
jgi:hypothetical protein